MIVLLISLCLALLEGKTQMKLNFAGLGRKVQHFAGDNSPAILTAIGVTGALTGAVLASKATMKATRIIDHEEMRYANYPDETKLMSNREKFEMVWKLYIPAVGVLTLTCVSIVCANRIGMRRTATAAAAAALAERGWDEYKEQVREQLGKKEERKIHDKVAEKKVERYLEKHGPVDVPTDGKVWCMDGYSGRPLLTTINAVEKAVNEINRQIQSNFEGSATISDFYDKIGLDSTSISDEYGWHTGQMLELKWTTTAKSDKTGPAFHVFDFDDEKDARPVLRPWAHVPTFP